MDDGEETLQIGFGADDKLLSSALMSKQLIWGELRLRYLELAIAGAFALVWLLLYYVLERHRIGLALRAVMRDAGMAEQQVPGPGVGHQVDRHALADPVDGHDRVGALDGGDPAGDGRVGAGRAVAGVGAHVTVPARISSSSRCSSDALYGGTVVNMQTS